VRWLAIALLLCALPAQAATLRGHIPGGARVAVWLEPIGAGGAEAAPARGQLDEAWLSFYPKVQVLPVGSTLVLANHDQETHTVHAHQGERTWFNVASVPHEREHRVTLDRPGVVTITCDIHREMRAYVVVTRSRFATVADLEGRFELADVPNGRYVVRAWRPPVRPHDETDPGEPVRTVELDERTLPITLELPPALAEEAPSSATPFVPDAPLHTPSSYPSFKAWPRGRAVPLASAFALVLGLVATRGLKRLARRMDAPPLAGAVVGCVLALFAGASVMLGLHGAVAATLAFALFIGSLLGVG
jgi:plastocyanin